MEGSYTSNYHSVPEIEEVWIFLIALKDHWAGQHKRALLFADSDRNYFHLSPSENGDCCALWKGDVATGRRKCIWEGEKKEFSGVKLNDWGNILFSTTNQECRGNGQTRKKMQSGTSEEEKNRDTNNCKVRVKSKKRSIWKSSCTHIKSLSLCSVRENDVQFKI